MSTIKVETISNIAGTKTIDVEDTVDVRISAWVNFNGTGTVAIRDDFNVSSITDNGTAYYTINFSTTMADTNYCWVGSAGHDTVSQQVWVSSPSSVAYTTWKTTSGIRLVAVYGNTLLNIDPVDFNVTVFGG